MASHSAPPTLPRSRFDALVVENRALCREHFWLRLRTTGPAPFPPTLPGQFIQLGCRPPNGTINEEVLLGGEFDWSPATGPSCAHQVEFTQPLAMLRRPFSLAGRADSAEGALLDVVHRVVGIGTAWLAGLKPGDPIDLIGPLGNSFSLPNDKHTALLVGGGVGLPPMFYLAERLRAEGWESVAFVGAMTRDLLAVDLEDDIDPNPEGIPALCARQFARHNIPTVITTDDGSLGLRGRITDGLSRLLESFPQSLARQTVIYTCGPEPMMHAVADLADRFRIDCQVCLEQAMACGMSTCQSCIVRIEERNLPHGQTPDGRPWRYRLACSDGPVFPSGKVVW